MYVLIKSESKSSIPKCCKVFSSHDEDKEDEEEIVNAKGEYDGAPSGSIAHVNDVNFNNGSSIAVGVTPLSHRYTSSDHLVEDDEEEKGENDDAVFLSHWSPLSRRILGAVLSIFSGCCYGVQFSFATYIQNHTIVDGVRASQNGLDYVFSQFTGIFVTSTTLLAGYVIYMRKDALINRNIVLPSLISGLMWGVATCCFFLANSTLSQAITFPIIATVPGMIGAFWGILAFREIKGMKNYLIFAAASSLTITGAILTALSK